MSSFPIPDNYSNKYSQTHLSKIPFSNDSFIIKKSKGVFLYDIDGNKYSDFYLQNGEIFGEYSPARLTSFLKNALSYGISSADSYHKFFFKAHRYWQENIQLPCIAFYTNLLELVLMLIRMSNKKKISIGYHNTYIFSLLQPLESLVELINVNKVHPVAVDILFFEKFNDDINEFDHNLVDAVKKVQIHSRFLFRDLCRKEPVFDKKYEHIIMSSPFGGKALCVFASHQEYYYPKSSFEDGILFLEGAKYFQALSQMTILPFTYPNFISYHGFAYSEKYLDRNFFEQRGIFLKNNCLFFSPFHTKHDYRRLCKAFDEYFNNSDLKH